MNKQILKEIFDSNFSYLFEIREKVLSSNDTIDKITVFFKTEKNREYLVEFRFGIENAYERYYTLNFGLASHNVPDFKSITNDNDILKILSTVLAILIYIIDNFKLKFIPIEITGYPKNTESWLDETSRDRIYKQLIRKNLEKLKYYNYKDLGRDGLRLIPIKQTLQEIFDLNFCYPYRLISPHTNINNSLIYIEGKFKSSNDLNYKVVFEFDWVGYTYSFYESSHLNDLTNENQPLKILSTVSNILIDILKKYKVRDAPIHIKGAPKNSTEDEIETSRDRIYKKIIQKNLHSLNYKMNDLGEKGLELVPINKNVLQENISFFKKFENRLLKNGFEAEFNPINDHLVTIQIVGMPKRMQGQGYGSRIMTILCQNADKLGVILQLTPAASSTHSRSKLIKFYSKFGFVENKGENRNEEYSYMYRLPKQKLIESNDIFSTLKFITPSLLIEKRSPSKGCVMLDIEFPEITDIQKQIKKEDLYIQEGEDSFGLEKDSHITLLYGLEKSVSLQQIKDILKEFLFPKTIKTKNISLFEKDEYDVLKFDIDASFLSKINKKLKELPYKNDYPDYKAHLTVAYLKKGKGKEYTRLFKDKKEYELKTTHCIYSSPNKTNSIIKITHTKSLKEKELKEIETIRQSDLHKDNEWDLSQLSWHIKYIQTYKSFKIYKDLYDSEFYFIKNNKVLVYFSIDFINEKLPSITYIEVNKKFANKGLGMQVYYYLIEKYGGLYSDEVQTQFAKNAWSILSTIYPTYLINGDNEIIKEIETEKDFTLAYKKSDYITLLALKKPANIKSFNKKNSYNSPDIGEPLKEIYLNPNTYLSGVETWSLNKINPTIIDQYKDFYIGQDKNKLLYLIRNNVIYCLAAIEKIDTYPSLVYIEVNPLFKKENYGFTFYIYFIQKYGGLFSDTQQTPKSRNAWLKLLQSFPVYKYNYITNTKSLVQNPDDLMTVYKNSDEILLALKK